MTQFGKYRGVDADGVAQTDADHFGNCPVCGAFVDMRDLAQVLDHVHGVEIEISEAPCSEEEPLCTSRLTRSIFAVSTAPMQKRNSTKWTPQDDERLLALRAAGKSNVFIAAALRRSKSAITSRLSILKLMMKEGDR